MLTMGCDTAKPDHSSAPQPTSQPPATPTQPTTNQETQQVSAPLDLSRQGILESLASTDGSTDIDASEPDNLLPDLFDDQTSKSGPRASGRVLMTEGEDASLQAVEGVEVTLQVPIN